MFDARFSVNESPELELLALRSRWNALGEGRGDALLHGGDLVGPPRSASECWSETGALTWHQDDLGWLSESGDPATCAFTEASFPPLETDTDR